MNPNMPGIGLVICEIGFEILENVKNKSSFARLKSVKPGTLDACSSQIQTITLFLN